MPMGSPGRERLSHGSCTGVVGTSVRCSHRKRLSLSLPTPSLVGRPGLGSLHVGQEPPGCPSLSLRHPPSVLPVCWPTGKVWAISCRLRRFQKWAQAGSQQRPQLPTSTSQPRAATQVAAVSIPGPQFTQMAARRQYLKIIQPFFFAFRVCTHISGKLLVTQGKQREYSSFPCILS